MKGFIKNKDSHMYKKNEYNEEEVLKASRQLKKMKKTPTSIALDLQTIYDLKKISIKKGIPYQVLMRSFILEGLEKAKKAK